jgi:DNA-binding transcriptional MocR family regulator
VSWMQILRLGCRESVIWFSRSERLFSRLGLYNRGMPLTDLQFNYPILPEQREQLSMYIQEAMKVSSNWVELPPYGGYEEHREAAARWLSRSEESFPSDRVMIAAGGHCGVMASLMVGGLRGKKIAADAMTYPGFKMQASWMDATLIPCECDELGMIPESLEHAAKNDQAAGVYLMPTVHNPLGIVMPLERRKQLCEVARRHNLVIIDDDAYGFCEAKPPASFASLAPERSYFVHSFTKPYAPAMKVAFVVFPEGKAKEMASALRALSSGAPALFVEVAARLIRSGEMELLLEAKREEAVTRQKIAAEAFAGLKTTAHPTSFHVWIELPESKSSDAIGRTLESEGILVSPSSGNAARDDVKSNAVRVALGAVRDLGALKAALKRVREAIDGQL